MVQDRSSSPRVSRYSPEMVKFAGVGLGVDGDGVPGAPGGNGEGDEVQSVEKNPTV
jgi:hypothetical protein